MKSCLIYPLAFVVTDKARGQGDLKNDVVVLFGSDDGEGYEVRAT